MDRLNRTKGWFTGCPEAFSIQEPSANEFSEWMVGKDSLLDRLLLGHRGAFARSAGAPPNAIQRRCACQGGGTTYPRCQEKGSKFGAGPSQRGNRRFMYMRPRYHDRYSAPSALRGTDVLNTTVTRRDDCRQPAFLDPCAQDLMQAGSDKVLKHEQNHFDLTETLAEKAQNDLRTLALRSRKSSLPASKAAAEAGAKKTRAAELQQLKNQVCRRREGIE
jgi:hypothetical protein